MCNPTRARSGHFLAVAPCGIYSPNGDRKDTGSALGTASVTLLVCLHSESRVVAASVHSFCPLCANAFILQHELYAGVACSARSSIQADGLMKPAPQLVVADIASASGCMKRISETCSLDPVGSQRTSGYATPDTYVSTTGNVPLKHLGTTAVAGIKLYFSYHPFLVLSLRIYDCPGTRRLLAACMPWWF